MILVPALISFQAWFTRLADCSVSPYGWQVALATEPQPRNQLIRIPTGLGKTFGVMAAWSWQHLRRGDATWPRRLVWCLPMCVLVEQTHEVVRRALESVDLLWDGRSDHGSGVGVHLPVEQARPEVTRAHTHGHGRHRKSGAE